VEEEIDLRVYIRALIHRWWWVVGFGVVAVVVGFVLSLLLPVLYEAKSVVMVTQPRYQMEFDPRFTTTEQSVPAFKAFPILAASDEVLQAVLDGYEPTADAGIKTWDLSTLSGMVKASSEGDPSLVLLRVRAPSPQPAAAIANLWADSLVRKGDEIYDEDALGVTALEDQVAEAGQALEQAEAALIDFEGRDAARILTAQLSAQEQAHADYLMTQITITNFIQDIQGLRAQWAQLPASQPTSLADDLTVLLFQIKAFNAQSPLPLQLQVSGGEPLSTASRQEQIAFLDGLLNTLQARAADMQARATALEPEILAVQQQLQEMTTERERRMRAQKLAQETYLTLARKLDEARIAAQTGNGRFHVGSYSAVPQRPASPQKLRNAAIAGMIGLMLGVCVALAPEWWKR
jgi:uncharacterized protein involved in exopolysaccharide biosynthesis